MKVNITIPFRLQGWHSHPAEVLAACFCFGQTEHTQTLAAGSVFFQPSAAMPNASGVTQK